MSCLLLVLLEKDLAKEEKSRLFLKMLSRTLSALPL
jgi:hypothetical protein